MKNVRIMVEYDGTAYMGWQRQPNGPTIQEKMEEAVERVSGERASVTGASRTDSGVHALGQVAAFKTASPLSVERLHMALNSVLPRDIVILECEEAPIEFHPRFDAKSKLYRYSVWSHRIRRVFDRERCWHVRWPLEIAKMNEGACTLIGKHDFGAFEGANTEAAQSVRTVTQAAWRADGDWLLFDIEGDGFLYNMVRAIVGTLVDVGRGKMSLGAFREGFESRDRRRAGPTAPACGLCLMQVRY